METVVKAFEELSTEELYEILRLRAAVFVVEQNCPYQDLDGIDKTAHHVWIRDGEGIAAYARVYDQKGPHIGRVISARRRKGYGAAVLREGIRVCRELYGDRTITISAQEYAREFYEKSGFRRCSEGYLEDGIPHIRMELSF